MGEPAPEPLRVLLANEREDHMALVAAILGSLGHSLIATSNDVAGVGELAATVHPDVALVGLGESANHALELIDRIVHEASCPVIVLLRTKNRRFIDQAAKRGVFGYLVDGDADELQGALDVTLSRFRDTTACRVPSGAARRSNVRKAS